MLPAYNEEKSVSSQLNSLNDFFASLGVERRFIVVNDASVDATAEETLKFKGRLNLELLNHKTNLGPGAAFDSAFKHILPVLRDDDIIITMDCDNTLQLKVLELMIQAVRQGADLVLGSIFVQGGLTVGVPFLRKVMTHGASLLYRIFFPIRGVRDYTAFYRAMRGSALKAGYAAYGGSLIESRGFGCMAEMLIRMSRIPVSIVEVPMTVRYDLKTSKSKLKVTKTIKEHLGIIGRNIFKSALQKF